MSDQVNRRDFLKRAGVVGAAMAIGTGSQELQANTRRPNLVYVFPDQYRRHAMGFVNEDPVLTPRLDAFAKEGVYLPHAVSNYPVCSPYRAMLMTGQWPARNGVMANCNSSRTHLDNFLKKDAYCLTDALSDAGYHTAYLGKWHLDGPPSTPEGERAVWDVFTPPGPRRHSIDFWYSYGAANNHMEPYYWTGDGGEDSRIDIKQWSPEHEADQAIAYIRNDGGDYRDADRPFAIFLSINPPHPPYHLVPDRYRELYTGKFVDDLLVRPNVDRGESGNKRAPGSVLDYFAMVSGVDEQFGRILDTLEAEGLADDTIVVFTSDHGEMMGGHGRMSKNVIYEESFNVPFLIRYANGIQARTDDLMLGTPDIYPTLLGLMGLGDRIPDAVEGVDRSSVIRDGSGVRPDAAAYMRLPPGRPSGGPRGVRTHRYTYQCGRPNQDAMLFDNTQDPYQMDNLAGKAPDLVKEMVGQMEAELERIQDPWLDRRGG
ncbi:MAG: sulfatase [Gemmatimonadetes bacterium]|nr:sulfatase [Gemmatimonadota bacterium]